jgi:hypothetical protein
MVDAEPGGVLVHPSQNIDPAILVSFRALTFVEAAELLNLFAFFDLVSNFARDPVDDIFFFEEYEMVERIQFLKVIQGIC